MFIVIYLEIVSHATDTACTTNCMYEIILCVCSDSSPTYFLTMSVSFVIIYILPYILCSIHHLDMSIHSVVLVHHLPTSIHSLCVLMHNLTTSIHSLCPDAWPNHFHTFSVCPDAWPNHFHTFSVFLFAIYPLLLLLKVVSSLSFTVFLFYILLVACHFHSLCFNAYYYFDIRHFICTIS